MAAPLQETRPVVRCTGCRLNQFLTASGLCRRCRRELPVPPTPVAEAAVEIAAPGPVPFKTGTTFGERLKLRRVELGFSMAEVASFSGINRSNIYEYERHKRRPTLKTIVRLAHVLRCSAQDLVPCEESVAA